MTITTTANRNSGLRARRVELLTTEFDLDRTPRFNPANNAATALARYLGQAEADRLKAVRKEHLRGWAAASRPGFSLADRALVAAAQTLSQAISTNQGLGSWTQAVGPTLITPQTLDVEPYSASPEAAAETVKSAARLFGAALVGITSLRRQWVLSHCNKKPIVFADTDGPQETEERYVIPERCRWVVSCAVEMSRAGLERSPSAIGEAASVQAASRAALLVASLAQFIRALGYVAVPDRADVLLEVPFAVAAGLGELGRLNHLVTPEFGPAVRLHSVITDLPMAVDQAIDFGLQELCRGCRLCVDACPAKALNCEEHPSWEPKGPWSNPGKRAWFGDAPKCQAYRQQITTNCGICFAACPLPNHPESQTAASHGAAAGKQDSWWKTPHSPFGL